MSKNKPAVVAANRYAVAQLMASRWDDEYLNSRNTEDVMKAYGLTIDQAVRLLDSEKLKRSKR
jgi:antitoxin component of RelBE/YafQ-DinJ toxin-antitoxin module